ncbi:uncharacterized protein CG3556-like [Argiope bruennichi]|uniref:Gastric intrinsic factor n=1 Tax=Argiope bruennichi TaxID=94029 RepID=A0A8T0EM17_ARGBR|nr:uncharacterized protein CG3556-like [Argiope bruennichi]KAF8776902.1 hypothetical protein HNY73_013839 [Argiope bruennichi]
MASFVCGFLFIILGTLVLGEESEVTSLDENIRGAVTRAVHWMKAQRREDYSWGGFTPRAVVALSLSQEVVPILKDEMTVMTKQLNILLSLELGRNFSMKSMRLSRLALYVNALYATCQDPRNFHGQDLVRILRSRTNSALVNASDFTLPVVFIPLCLAQDIGYQDVHHIIKMYRSLRNKTDLQALTLLGLTCIAQLNRSAINKQYVDSFAADFMQNFRSIAPSSDVYTLALALQVLRAVSGGPVDVNPLIEKQSPDGSFGSLLGTYYALPALLGKNVFAIKDKHCSKDDPLDNSLAYPLFEPSSPKVHYSVWKGEGDDRDSHTVTVTLPSNGTFFDVMQMAQARNLNFRFSYEERDRSKHVYSVGGAPNDVQRELYWILYKTVGQPNGFHPQTSMQKVIGGVDQIHPAPDDHYIFWFRRHSPYGV